MLAQAALIAMATLVSMASASKEEFPLVWVCLGITIVGVAIAMYVAYRRPMELRIPGANGMAEPENEEPTTGKPVANGNV